MRIIGNIFHFERLSGLVCAGFFTLSIQKHLKVILGGDITPVIPAETRNKTIHFDIFDMMDELTNMSADNMPFYWWVGSFILFYSVCWKT